MFNIGTPELLLLLLIAFVVFGPRHLPRLGRAAGRLIGEWRKLTGDLERAVRDEPEAGTGDRKAVARSRRPRTADARAKTRRA